MNRVLTVPRAVENMEQLIIGNRVYGETGPEHLSNLRKMAVPREMSVLSDTLQRQSALLALPVGSATNAIYNAYGADLELVTRYRNAFQRTIEAAIRARADAKHADAQAFLTRKTAEVSEIVHEPTLDLGPDALTLDPATLLSQLQQQFINDVESLKFGITTWMHLLAESDYVSVVEWLNPAVVRYHFFRMDDERRELGKTVTDPGMSVRGRAVTTTTRAEVKVFAERRVHTVVNAKTNALDKYPRRVPNRIARLIDTIPPEVRQFVTIIDGMVSQETVHRRTVSTAIDEQTRSVWVDDPAVTLFETWALGGWGGSTSEAAGSRYKGHALSRADKFLLGQLVLVAFVVILGSIADGWRGGLAFGGICAILAISHQISIRIPTRR